MLLATADAVACHQQVVVDTLIDDGVLSVVWVSGYKLTHPTRHCF